LLSITIDWLSVTFKDFYDGNGEIHNEEKSFISTYASVPPLVSTSARFGYTDGHQDANGTIVQWNPEYSQMGHHVQFSGSALRNILVRSEIRVETLLRSAIDARGRVSRLDLAKDCTGEAVDLQAIYQSLEQGLNRGLARKWSQVISNDNGHTIYVGSRQSERFIRIYDKAAESKIQGELWFRFELETKGDVAKALAQQLVSRNDWNATFDGLARAMVNLPNSSDYERFFTRGVVPIGLPKLERTSDREKWIESQVIPAVARHYIDNPNSEAVTRLISTLNMIDRQRKE
jgi:hypothetical protein